MGPYDKDDERDRESVFGTVDRHRHCLLDPKLQFSPLVCDWGLHFQVVFYGLWIGRHGYIWEGAGGTDGVMVYLVPSFVMDQQALPRRPAVTAPTRQEEAPFQLASHATRWSSSDVPQVNHHHSLLSRASWLTIYLSYIDVVMIFCSGDCGMYAIKYIEHLLCGLPLDTIINDNMSLFRKKWSVDLWYQDATPWVFLGCAICIYIFWLVFSSVDLWYQKFCMYIFWYYAD